MRAIVLTHVPPAFCAGADLKERRAGPPDSSPMVRVLRRLMDAEVPTIAAVEGPARAGGIGLMASCDLVVVERDLTFALTEVRIGVAAAIISVPILRRASGSPAGGGVPDRRAVRRRLRPRRRAGHATSPTTSTRRWPALCDGIRLGAPRAVAETKRMLRDGPGDGARREAFERMRALSDELFAGPDAAEGMAAFAEKRPPPGPDRSVRQNRRRQATSTDRTRGSPPRCRPRRPARGWRVAERDERVGGGDAPHRAREAVVDEPGDDRLADAARLRRVSSTTTTRPTSRAWRATSSIGSGASQRRSSTRHSMPSAASRSATRSDR